MLDRLQRMIVKFTVLFMIIVTIAIIIMDAVVFARNGELPRVPDGALILIGTCGLVYLLLKMVRARRDRAIPAAIEPGQLTSMLRDDLMKQIGGTVSWSPKWLLPGWYPENAKAARASYILRLEKLQRVAEASQAKNLNRDCASAAELAQ